MDEKTFTKLELDKILKQLADHAAFSASRELLEQLRPTADLEEARRRLQETSEARRLIEERDNVTVGGARDVRPHASNAERGITLSPEQLLTVKATLQSSANLKKTIMRAADRFPLLAEMAVGLYEGKPVVDAITRVISEQGEVLDSASPKLAQIRRDLHVAHNRLQTRLQSLLSSGKYAPYLQETLITQRDGRYVIPVKSEARGRVRGIVHDQSSSGATLFVEPVETVDINNEIRELEIAEQNEILRILQEITALVGDHADPIRWSVDALAALDAAFARGKYANALRGSAPALVGFDDHRIPGSTIRLYNARHPLIDPRVVVSIDIEIDEGTFILIITGPNTGGKTVSLKTAGLMVLMAQCGLHIPASPDSVLTVFETVFADIGDEQSIEQSLSTFSAHLTHINQILDRADDRSLVLLDELGSGTDPTEGAAIARAILNELRQRGVTTFVATHYPELKLYAHSTPGVRNASVEFDVETLSPTYRLIIGLPGRSNAIAIATRLGLPRSILAEAQSFVGADDLHTDDLLDEIHRTRDEIRETQQRLARAEREVGLLRTELQQRLDSIEAEREAVITQARDEAQAELDMLLAEVSELRRRLQTIPPTYQAERDAASEGLADLQAETRALEALIEAPARRERARPAAAAAPQPVAEPEARLQAGDRVFVYSLNAEGEVIELAGNDIEVQVGQFRVRVPPDGVEYRSRRASKQAAAEAQFVEGVKRPRPESPGLELHLRGLTLDDALPMLEEYLDQAYLSGLPWVRIVHGKGTGVLRRGVQDTLRRSSLVKKYEIAPANQGGEGATIVYFVALG
jgi:DNA mismatch repair protein MutS2